jgi:hypothetical protein
MPTSLPESQVTISRQTAAVIPGCRLGNGDGGQATDQRGAW